MTKIPSTCIRGNINVNLKNIKKKEIKLFTNGIRVVVERNNQFAVCPHCGIPSNRVYEYRKQIVLDKPVNDKKVEIELNKRRFVCVNRACPTKTFTEEVEGLATTKRYTQAFEEFLKELIGRKGYLRAQKILSQRYNLRLSLSSLFYLNFRHKNY